MTDKGLAPGQANLAHAQGDEGPRDPAKFLQGKHLGLGHELHGFGHAVHAAKVAAIGHGKAQILHAPTETIEQRAWFRLSHGPQCTRPPTKLSARGEATLSSGRQPVRMTRGAGP